MIRLFLVLMLEVFIFQPIRLVLGFLMRFTWHPPKVKNNFATISRKDLVKQISKKGTYLDTNKYKYGGDAAKFLGLYYFASKAELSWKNVINLVKDSGIIQRNLKEPYTNKIDFSTDMLAGLLLAVSKRLPLLNKEEKTKLSKLWDRTTWEGFPMVFTNATTNKETLFSRGHVWRPWWVLGSEEILTALVWFELGYKITNKTRYKVFYYLFRILLFPSTLITCPDAQFFIGKVYALSSYNTHSKTMVFRAGYDLTGSNVFKHALKVAYKRHGEYNADIALLAGSVVDKDKKYLEITNKNINACLNKGTRTTNEIKTYISLLFPPHKVKRLKYITDASYKGADYVWERNPIKPKLTNDNYRDSLSLDFIVSALLYLEDIELRG